MAIDIPLISIRVVELVILIITSILVAVGAGICISLKQGIEMTKNDSDLFRSVFGCKPETLTIAEWRNDRDPEVNRHIIGQYYAFASTLLMCCLTGAGIFVAIIDEQKFVFASGLCIIMCFVNFGLEIWYAAEGYDLAIPSENLELKMPPFALPPNFHLNLYQFLHVYNQSWAAAAGFYFILAILFMVDIVIDIIDL